MARSFVLGIFILALLGPISGMSRVPGGCEQSLFVEDEVMIDVPLNANCKWQIQTEKDHVLVFTIAQDGNFEQVQEFLSIHDGIDVDSPVLLFKNQKVSEVLNKKLPEAVYTSGSVAEVRFKKTPTSALKLKIQKAVDCPLNLGPNSQCGRVVDEVSCYCVTTTMRNHLSQMTYCNDNQMKLLALETRSEETAIYAAWGTSTVFWTSGTDSANEGIWVWESTNAILPCPGGYSNWANLQPDNAGNIENCLALNWRSVEGWNDYPCSNSYQAICEAHP